MSTRVKVNRHGNCPYCDGVNLQIIQVLRPDRTAMKCGGCAGFSVKHSNGFQYPLENRTDFHSAPAVSYLE